MHMSSTIKVKVKDKVKKEASEIFKELGMDMHTAVNIYLKQVIRDKGIPFVLSTEACEDIALKAIKAAGKEKKKKKAKKETAAIEKVLEELSE